MDHELKCYGVHFPTWPNGMDIDPDQLYELGEPCGDKTKEDHGG